MEMTDNFEDYGRCCICESSENVLNLWTLNWKVDGGALTNCWSSAESRWGCVQCHLPSEGAMVIICDMCAEKHAENPDIEAELKFIMNGKVGRLPISVIRENPRRHLHDWRYHLNEFTPDQLTWWKDSPDAGPDCYCSLCGKPIDEPDIPIRRFDTQRNCEQRLHLECFQFLDRVLLYDTSRNPNSNKVGRAKALA